MNIKEICEYWCTFDDDTRNELLSITDEKEIEDRFYKELEFGTGGLRGIMGAGPNRMNRYTIAKATKGYADYLKSRFDGEISVAITDTHSYPLLPVYLSSHSHALKRRNPPPSRAEGVIRP